MDHRIKRWLNKNIGLYNTNFKLLNYHINVLKMWRKFLLFITILILIHIQIIRIVTNKTIILWFYNHNSYLYSQIIFIKVFWFVKSVYKLFYNLWYSSLSVHICIFVHVNILEKYVCVFTCARSEYFIILFDISKRGILYRTIKNKINTIAFINIFIQFVNLF